MQTIAHKKSQFGFGSFYLILLLVVVSAVLGGLFRLVSLGQLNYALDEQIVRSEIAIESGKEWAKFQSLRQQACPAFTTLQNVGVARLTVELSCDSRLVLEGESSYNQHSWTILACNQNSCLNPRLNARYVERKHILVLTVNN